ncbi:MAG: 1-acyl-sn-glycerol-3-phosphate acyltransferase [Prevotella sp.]|nr:1-acyl-sn-glycerol-3-phosphate acyltransferase [Prevotella sp.]MBR5061879.1 1-acyl-sn-glycerol-3-phosphate acyltransferase [Prevotella sp.]
MKYLYRTYQLFVALPLGILATIITAVTVMVGCWIGNGHFWGYYPGKWWAWFIIRILLLPVKVEGRENLDYKQSYVFVSNHQGAFDIFLIYGFLNRNFKWMMKRQLRKMPLVGPACEASHQIFVDKRGASKIRETYDKARNILREGMSLVVFPEGARTFTGHMGLFRRGAFMLADDLQLPVVPMTINGSFDVMPRMRDGHFVTWHSLRLTIHKPIPPVGKGAENIRLTEEQSYATIMGGLVPEYQGYMENPDQ